MILTDVNLLIYAYNQADERYPIASKWFEGLMDSQEAACFCWETLNGFIRIVTNKAAVPDALSLKDAFDIVSQWMEQPNFVLLTPTNDHFNVLKRISIEASAVGKRYSDAILAAYAISHHAKFASTDKHFRMFEGLKLIDPLTTVSS